MAISDHYSFLQLVPIENKNVSNTIHLKYIGGTIYIFDNGKSSISYDKLENTKDENYYSRFTTSYFEEAKSNLKNFIDVKNEIVELSFREEEQNKKITVRLKFLNSSLRKKERFLLKDIVVEAIAKVMEQDNNKQDIWSIRKEYLQKINEVRLFKKLEDVRDNSLETKIKRKL